ncbi:uncharacterized protein LOC119740273 [Patiria miniata]|uniref:Ig-like domain-containing protein n=1 Tax=Patiria miniata TaxID=46514 RepID=A0A914B7Q7_PATMI|nr:uncharacterized protein LOC119740273 [Patiria miniata]
MLRRDSLLLMFLSMKRRRVESGDQTLQTKGSEENQTQRLANSLFLILDCIVPIDCLGLIRPIIFTCCTHQPSDIKMKTFLYHSLFLISALLVCVLPSAHLAAAIIPTKLRPVNPSVPEGGQIRLICTGLTPDCEYKSFLYKAEGNSVMGVQASNPTSSHSCSCDAGRRCSSSTIFVMTATPQAAGTYGCVVLPNGQQQPPSEIRRSGEQGHRTHETTVTVCEGPDLSLHEHSNGNFTTVTASDNCHFEGELSWRINGHPVPLESASPAPSAELSPPAAVHRDNDLLAISKCDRRATRTPCTVTAEFTYISARRLKVAHMSTDIHDCCVDLPSTVVPTKPLLTQRPQEPLTKVLKLMEELLPLQIRFFKKWSRTSPDRLAQAIAGATLDEQA